MVGIRLKAVILSLFFISAVPKSRVRDEGMAVLKDWFMYPSKASGKEISSKGFDVSGWYWVKVPTTVFGGLIQNGIYKNLYSGKNLAEVEGFQDILWRTEEMPEDSPFRAPWWFRTSFTSRTGRAVLHLDGINYRAEVWLNGEKWQTV